MRKVTGLFVCCAFLLSGCGITAKAVGAGPWPIYDEVPAAEFTPAETATLTAFAKANKSLYNKVIGQDHAWRAIVQTHNKAALKHNRDVLKTMGFNIDSLTDDDVQRLATDAAK